MITSKMPLELQLAIVGYLDPLDIFYLQLTCKHLYDLIEDSAEMVWRNCLNQHCLRNGLFWPSFAHLTTVAEYKHAATAPLRFSTAYHRASKNDSVLEKRCTRLQFPTTYTTDSMILDIHLIPGGRFLATFSDNGTMSIWDLRLAPKLEMVLSMPLECFHGVAYSNVVDCDKVHILYELDLEIPAAYTATPPEDTAMTTHEFVELSFSVEDHKFHAQSSGRFSLIRSSETQIQAHSVMGDKIISLVDDVTIVWDHKHDVYAGWKLGGVSTPSEIFCNEGYIIYITNEGVQGITFPEYVPVTNEFVTLASLAETVRTPTFSIPFERPYDLARTDSVPNLAWGSDICVPVGSDRQFVFDIRESSFTESRSGEPIPQDIINSNEFEDSQLTGTLSIHRYALKYHSQSPSSSSLSFIGTTTHTMPYEGINYPQCYPAKYLSACYYQWCDGPQSTVTVWSDPGGYVAGWPDSGHSGVFMSLVDGKERMAGGEVEIVPLVHPHEVANETFLVEKALCPATAKGVLMWAADPDSDEWEGPWEWFDLFDVV
ncbi:hypothetical protein DFP72DRAFT_939589 [Ephemerocybe angulata]|uniref:F-box domain-containing protein n=1 Tax=Ephemerocybe angulata TaxID=980116 RepID=A0A8H6H7Y8_9AGAR|nr:hypothetical protein DFP72DRAFT_939589 [Tulosesus angulatus]